MMGRSQSNRTWPHNHHDPKNHERPRSPAQARTVGDPAAEPPRHLTWRQRPRVPGRRQWNSARWFDQQNDNECNDWRGGQQHSSPGPPLADRAYGATANTADVGPKPRQNEQRLAG
jgi:hypothetical protein